MFFYNLYDEIFLLQVVMAQQEQQSDANVDHAREDEPSSVRLIEGLPVRGVEFDLDLPYQLKVIRENEHGWCEYQRE